MHNNQPDEDEDDDAEEDDDKDDDNDEDENKDEDEWGRWGGKYMMMEMMMIPII